MNRLLGYSVYLSLIRNGSVSLDDIGNGAPVFLSLHIEEEFDENYSSDILRLCSRLHEKGCRIIADISKKTLEMLGTDVDAIAEKLHLSAKESTVSVTTAAGDISDFEFTVIGQPFQYAPVSAGDEAGKLRISFMGREVRTVPLYADEDIAFDNNKSADRKGLFAKIKEKIWRFFSL